MRRILTVLSVTVLMAAMLAASAMPAFARPPAFAANENDSCVGQAYSSDVPAGYKGQLVSGIAKNGDGEVGENSSYYASFPRDKQTCHLL